MKRNKRRIRPPRDFFKGNAFALIMSPKGQNASVKISLSTLNKIQHISLAKSCKNSKCLFACPLCSISYEGLC